MSFFIFLTAIIATSVLGYFGTQRVLAKSGTEETTLAMVEPKSEKIIDPRPVSVSPVSTVENKPQYRELSMLSTDIDWSQVSACLSSQNNGCQCYGLSTQRLMIPKESCEAAVMYGWGTTKKL